MVELAWLAHVPLPPARLHRIPAELGPVTGARAYARELAPIEEFDLVLLGLGTDGHTASLFPGQPWGETREAPAALPVHHALFPPAERVSLSAWRLCAARQVVFLVTGSDKADALERWQAGEPLPAAALRPPGGVDVWIG